MSLTDNMAIIAQQNACPAGNRIRDFQVAVTSDGAHLIALANDGTLWRYHWQRDEWIAFPELGAQKQAVEPPVTAPEVPVCGFCGERRATCEECWPT